MTTSVMVLIAVGIINLILLIINLGLFKDLNTIKILTGQMHAGLGTLASKIHMQDSYLQKLGNAFSDFTETMDELVDKMNNPFMNVFDKSSSMYKTLDGKYSGTSIEDLISKIKNAGEEDQYLTDAELDDLKKMFESDDVDDDTDDFNPSKGKF